MNQYRTALCYPNHRRLAPEPYPHQQARAEGGGEFPLAMAYVPMQCWGHTYEPAVGLQRGTIFPELDLPFCCGRCRK